MLDAFVVGVVAKIAKNIGGGISKTGTQNPRNNKWQEH